MSTDTKSLYETDFAEWSKQTATLIRAGRFDEIDTENVAEEIEDLSRSQRSAIWSHLSPLLMHKIKQLIQPERDCASWQVSIETSRLSIQRLLKDSPSLRPYLREILHETYEQALRLAVLETAILEEAPVPKECPWDLESLIEG